jgi:hypothetical protein
MRVKSFGIRSARTRLAQEKQTMAALYKVPDYHTRTLSRDVRRISALANLACSLNAKKLPPVFGLGMRQLEISPFVD